MPIPSPGEQKLYVATGRLDLHEIEAATQGFLRVNDAREADVMIFDLDQPPQDWANYLKDGRGVDTSPKFCLVLQLSQPRDAKTRLIMDQIREIAGPATPVCREFASLVTHLQWWVRSTAASARLKDVTRQMVLAASKTQPRVFVSYHHEDKQWVERLKTMYAPVGGEVDFWDDSRLEAGQTWEEEILTALESSSAGILLVTSQFLASKYIRENELPRLLSAARGGTLRILWIAVGSCLWEKTAIANYQALNNPKQPLETLSESDQNATLKEIADKIWLALKVRTAYV